MVAAPGIGSLASVAGSLTVILALLFGAALLARRLRDGRWAGRRNSPTQINITATRQIGANASLMIVEVEGQRFLIGTGRNGLTSLGALAHSPGFADSLARAEQTPPAAS